jgi:hypothetical protein
MEKHGRARLTADDNIRVIRYFACWIPGATDPHCEYVILFAFPQQQPRCYIYTYIVCLVH